VLPHRNQFHSLFSFEEGVGTISSFNGSALENRFANGKDLPLDVYSYSTQNTTTDFSREPKTGIPIYRSYFLMHPSGGCHE
jgi:hypothetical protein